MKRSALTAAGDMGISDDELCRLGNHSSFTSTKHHLPTYLPTFLPLWVPTTSFGISGLRLWLMIKDDRERRQVAENEKGVRMGWAWFWFELRWPSFWLVYIYIIWRSLGPCYLSFLLVESIFSVRCMLGYWQSTMSVWFPLTPHYFFSIVFLR